MTTPAFALSAAHDLADINVSNANAALDVAEALRRIAVKLWDAACEVDASMEPGDRNDVAFIGLEALGNTIDAWATELTRKGLDYRKGLI